MAMVKQLIRAAFLLVAFSLCGGVTSAFAKVPADFTATHVRLTVSPQGNHNGWQACVNEFGIKAATSRCFTNVWTLDGKRIVDPNTLSPGDYYFAIPTPVLTARHETEAKAMTDAAHAAFASKEMVTEPMQSQTEARAEGPSPPITQPTDTASRTVTPPAPVFDSPSDQTDYSWAIASVFLFGIVLVSWGLYDLFTNKNLWKHVEPRPLAAYKDDALRYYAGVKTGAAAAASLAAAALPKKREFVPPITGEAPSEPVVMKGVSANLSTYSINALPKETLVPQSAESEKLAPGPVEPVSQEMGTSFVSAPAHPVLETPAETTPPVANVDSLFRKFAEPGTTGNANLKTTEPNEAKKGESRLEAGLLARNIEPVWLRSLREKSAAGKQHQPSDRKEKNRPTLVVNNSEQVATLKGGFYIRTLQLNTSYLGGTWGNTSVTIRFSLNPKGDVIFSDPSGYAHHYDRPKLAAHVIEKGEDLYDLDLKVGPDHVLKDKPTLLFVDPLPSPDTVKRLLLEEKQRLQTA